MRNRFSTDKSSLSTCHPLLDEVLFKTNGIILIYGEAASGKTNFCLNILKCSQEKLSLHGKRAIYISTEGSTYIDRVLQLGIDSNHILFTEALSQDHLIDLITEVLTFAIANTVELVIIDSINNYYRVEASTIEGLHKFLSLLAVLTHLNADYGVYVIATAQVRKSEEGDVEPSGLKYLDKWADIVMRIETISETDRLLMLERIDLHSHDYVQKAFRFRIVSDGIQWL